MLDMARQPDAVRHIEHQQHLHAVVGELLAEFCRAEPALGRRVPKENPVAVLRWNVPPCANF